MDGLEDVREREAFDADLVEALALLRAIIEEKVGGYEVLPEILVSSVVLH